MRPPVERSSNIFAPNTLVAFRFLFRSNSALLCFCFKRNEDGGYSYVFKQPESPEEEARCKEAKEGCPVEAIGDNGG